ncbi:trypsin-like serine peptidase [Oligoflexus tunisiensis]|uniref:trypsin-like serine peptidase n=1 Tax=Oligoflexus tunisiensis TaxID=708132 RepID=UPI00114CA079|nr:serine protease [Oligoflexus tunisiensis]
MIRHAVSLGALVFITACQPSENSKVLSIIDQDSLIEINEDTPLPHQNLKHDFPAIGRMTGGCTAFHVGEGLVATAGHCLADLAANPVDVSCHSMDITWGDLAGESHPSRSRCLKVLEYKYDQEADYALIQVDPIPATAVVLERDPRAMNFREQAMVVGYPKGRALSLSGTCEALLNPDPKAQIFHHRCDTLPGNSGSPVFDAATLEVIGVHNGDADDSANYGSYLPGPEHVAALTGQLQTPDAQPEALQFGPFADQLKKDLVHFTREQGDHVSFQMKLDIEDGYDKVVVIDGLGRIQEWTGTKDTAFQQLATPVSIIVLTDYSGTSESLALSSIQFE